MIERRDRTVDGRCIGQAVAIVDRVGEGWQTEVASVRCECELARIQRDQAARNRHPRWIAIGDRMAVDFGDSEGIGLGIRVVRQHGHIDGCVLRGVERIIDRVWRGDHGDGDGLDAG